MNARISDLIDPLVEQAISQELFRGAVIRVDYKGKPLIEHPRGHAQWDETAKIPMEADYLFDLASLSKLFSSTAVLRIISRGDIRTNTKIVDLLGFKNSFVNDSLAHLPVSSLLDHSSGIHYWFPFYTRRRDSFEEILASVLTEHPLKDHMIYSDLNFMLIGLCIERIMGKSLPQAMQELLFDPINLKHTTYSPPVSRTVATEFGNRIEQQMVDDLGLSFSSWRDTSSAFRGVCDDGNCHYYFGGASGHAGIFADAADVTRLGNLYSDPDSMDFISPSVLAVACTKQRSDRGFGFQFGDIYPREGFGHTGFTGTYLYINPVLAVTITILTNRLHVNHPLNQNLFRKEIVEKILSVIE